MTEVAIERFNYSEEIINLVQKCTDKGSFDIVPDRACSVLN
jgi:hypothetical protein